MMQGKVPVTGTGSPRRPEYSEAGSGFAGGDAPDPWGVRRAENLLTSLEGVLSARVVTTPLGEVSEIHILAQSGTAPKQVVRNVESALLAQLGLRVDHRKISIAQTADVRPIETLDQDAVSVRARHRAVLFENMTVSPSSRPHHINLTVTLSHNGKSESADADSSDTPRSRVEAAARATIQVLDRLIEGAAVALDGAKIVEGFDCQFVFAAVQGLGGRDSLLLTGTAQIRESAERAAVFAVLDATNRWTAIRRAS
jgi:hypothetical protein